MLLCKKQTLESLMYGAPKVYSTKRANLSGKRTEHMMQQCIRLSTLFRGSFSPAVTQLEYFLFCLPKTGFLPVFFPQSFYQTKPLWEKE